MVKTLTADIGNSRTKLCLFERDGMVWKGSATDGAALLRSVLKDTTVDRATVCRTGRDEPLMQLLQAAGVKVLMVTGTTPTPLKVDYVTPQTLGGDRLAAVTGAQTVWPRTDVLVIDAGTCITYDVLTRDGEYLGGNIAPGLAMRLKAMHEGTAGLPLVEYEGRWPQLTGGSTKEALLGGVLWGIRAEMAWTIDEMRRERPALKVLFTGGDGRMFEEKINREDTQTDEWLVARGLNRISEYNND